MKEKKLIPKRRFKEFENAGAWEQRKLGEVTESFSGGTPSVGNLQYYGGTIPFIRSGEISSDKTELFVTEAALNNSSAKMVKMGDVLYALYGATSGEVSISRINGAINQAILAIRSTRNDDHYFIGQWLRMQKEQIISTYLQGGQGNLSGSIVKELMINLPADKEEQKLISSFLSNLDNLITLHQHKLKKLKEMKSAYLSEMFPKEGEKYPKLRFDGFTDPWEQRKFSSLANLRRGLTYKPTDVRNEGVIVLRSSNINQNRFILNEDDVFVHEKAINIDVIKENDILITSANGSSHLVGKHALVKKMATKAVHGGFMLAASANNPFFVNALMSSSWYSRFIKTYIAGGNGAIGNLRRSDLENQVVSVPDEMEQEKIGEFFKSLDNLINLNQSKLEKLENLKKAYLNEMFV